MKNVACAQKAQTQASTTTNNQPTSISIGTYIPHSKFLHSHSMTFPSISFFLSNSTKLFLSSKLKPPLLPMSHSTITNSIPCPKTRLRGVVFDMDGTLTVPAIDFAAMYRAVLGDDEYRRIKASNPSSGIDILHHIETLSPDQQRKAYDTIADYERQGLDRLQIMPGMYLSLFQSTYTSVRLHSLAPSNIFLYNIIFIVHGKIWTWNKYNNHIIWGS